MSTSASVSMAIVARPRPGVSVITLNDPDTLNSLSFGLVGALLLEAQLGQ